MLYGCVTGMVAHDDIRSLPETHRGFLQRCHNEHTSSRNTLDYRILPYHVVFTRSSYEFIETTTMKQTLPHTGRVVHVRDDRLPNIVCGVMV